MNKGYKIIPLEAGHVKKLAKWHHREWKELYWDWDIDFYICELRSQIGDEQVPYTWVCMSDNKIVGSVSIINDDLKSHAHLNPWIGNLYVKKSYRNQGIGTSLLKFAMAKAVNWDISPIYLFSTHHVEFFTRHDWQVVETFKHNDKDITILKFSNAAK